MYFLDKERGDLMTHCSVKSYLLYPLVIIFKNDFQ